MHTFSHDALCVVVIPLSSDEEADDADFVQKKPKQTKPNSAPPQASSSSSSSSATSKTTASVPLTRPQTKPKIILAKIPEEVYVEKRRKKNNRIRLTKVLFLRNRKHQNGKRLLSMMYQLSSMI